MLTVKDASLTSTMIEGILYGFSVVLFLMTLQSLIHNRTVRGVNRLMLVVAFLLFILSTLHIIADILHVHQGFINETNPDLYFAEAKGETFKNSIYELETLLADAVLIYRCYIVWRSWYIIVIPCILWVSVAVCATATVWFISQPAANGSNIFLIETGRWVISFYSTAFVTNFIATSLLAYRIWTINSRVYKAWASNTSSSQTHYRSTDLKPLLIFIIECGALYSFSLLTMLATYLSHSTGAYIVIDMIGQIIPITFYMIIIRAAMTRTKEKDRHLSVSNAGFAVDRSGTQGTAVAGVRVQIDRLDDTELGVISQTETRSEYTSKSMLDRKGGEDLK